MGVLDFYKAFIIKTAQLPIEAALLDYYLTILSATAEIMPPSLSAF